MLSSGLDYIKLLISKSLNKSLLSYLMALLKSVNIKLGTKMPDFLLRDANGDSHHSVNLYGEKGMLVVFTCNHCPYAQAVWPRMIDIAEKALQLGISTAAINPNIHPDYSEDSAEAMLSFIEKNNIKFPYLVDSTQATARKYKAQCTPDIYLMNAEKELVYHGRVDDNWQQPEKVKKHELLEAINNLANGFSPIPEEEQKPSLGCSIKWRDDEGFLDDSDDVDGDLR